MNASVDWRRVWEEKAGKSVSDYEFDRGTSPRNREIEDLSKAELLDFIDPQPDDIVFDAGCGTGANIFLLHSKVKRVVGMDCTIGALGRCQRQIEADEIENVELLQGDVTNLRSPDGAVDKVLCMSVFQYLNDDEVRRALREFARILRRSGTLILHVKNKSSIYLSTLCVAKKLKLLLGKQTKVEHFRPFAWYVVELRSAGFEVLAYNSFNILMIESMPKSLLLFLQRMELKRYRQFPFRLDFLRRHGSELKIKAKIGGR